MIDKKKKRRPRAHNSTLPAPSKPLGRSKKSKRAKAAHRRQRPQLPSRNEKRHAKRKAEGKVYGPLHRAYDALPCFLAGHPLHTCVGPVRGHHRKRIASGGLDEEGEIPACVAAHDELHWSEIKVAEKYGVNLDDVQRRAREEVMRSALDAPSAHTLTPTKEVITHEVIAGPENVSATAPAGGDTGGSSRRARLIDLVDTGLHVLCGRHFPGLDERMLAANPSIHDDGCGREVSIASAYRCIECDAFFHRGCAVAHFARHTAERSCPHCGEQINPAPAGGA